jgi:hypothetical protein
LGAYSSGRLFERVDAVMSWSASDLTAFDLIAVHGQEALVVADECIRVLLRNSDIDGVSTWLTVLEAIQRNLPN